MMLLAEEMPQQTVSPVYVYPMFDDIYQLSSPFNRLKTNFHAKHPQFGLMHRSN